MILKGKIKTVPVEDLSKIAIAYYDGSVYLISKNNRGHYEMTDLVDNNNLSFLVNHRPLKSLIVEFDNLFMNHVDGISHGAMVLASTLNIKKETKKPQLHIDFTQWETLVTNGLVDSDVIVNFRVKEKDLVDENNPSIIVGKYEIAEIIIRGRDVFSDMRTMGFTSDQCMTIDEYIDKYFEEKIVPEK